MENIKESVISKSIWEEDPEYAQELQNVYDYLKKTPFSKAFPNKYKATLKSKAAEKTYALFIQNPEMLLKTVVTTVLNDLNDDLSPELLVEITQFIVGKWKHFSATANLQKSTVELV
jgi:hypothetical protein